MSDPFQWGSWVGNLNGFWWDMGDEVEHLKGWWRCMEGRMLMD